MKKPLAIATAACIASLMALLLLVRLGIGVSSSARCDSSNIQRAVKSERSSFSALPASTYLSYPDVEFLSEEISKDQYDLGFIDENENFRTDARVIVNPERNEITLKILRDGCPIKSANNSDSAILTLEHIYGVVLSSGTDAIFRIETCVRGWSCEVSLQLGASQYHVLRQIHKLRNSALTHDDRPHRYRVWKQLEISDSGADRDTVWAKILDQGKPVKDMHVAFSKKPHMGCFAHSDTQGNVHCTLEDFHGHDHDHNEDEVGSYFHTVTVTGKSDKNSVTLPISRTFAQ